MNTKGIDPVVIGVPEIRHFLYKSKSKAQLLCSEVMKPYDTVEEFRRLESMYYEIHHQIHNSNRPTKLIYRIHEKEIVLAWVSLLSPYHSAIPWKYTAPNIQWKLCLFRR